MSEMRNSVEQVINCLREAEVLLAQGKRVRRDLPADQSLGGELRNELFDGEIICNLKAAQVLIERRRRHYNTHRPHSTLG